MTLRLNGSSSGYTEIDAPATAGNNNLKLPGGNGSDGNILGTDGAGNLSWVNGRMVLGNAQSSTSGTSVDYFGIPSWAKRVTLSFVAVSTNGTSSIEIRLGTSAGFEASGYVGTTSAVASTVASSNLSTGFTLNDAASATNQRSGSIVFTVISGNTWAASGNFSYGDSARLLLVSGAKAMAGPLDRIRVTTANGTDTFDNGSINILYEG